MVSTGAHRSSLSFSSFSRPALRTSSPKVSVVIPTLNEAKNLPHVLPRVPQWVAEIIVVDGLSVDDTIEVARRSRDDVRTLKTKIPGKGAAMRAGIEAAIGDIVVFLDADGSTDPDEMPAFVGALLAGADVAVCSRFAVGGGTSDMELHRRLGNWALTRAVRVAFGVRYSDLCYGYLAFWKDVWPELDGPFTGFEVETVLHIRAVTAGLRVAEVPSFETERIWGLSNLHPVRDGVRVLSSIVREWRRNRVDGQLATATRPEVHPAPPATDLPWEHAPLADRGK
jgi:glycosyltransferase involved in cell wall biosynthesis